MDISASFPIFYSSKACRLRFSPKFLPLLMAGMLLTPFSCLADYFHDQGIYFGDWRTDYNSPTTGTASNPLLLGTGCYYPQSEHGTDYFVEVHPHRACPTDPTIYPGGPYYWSNRIYGSTYWVVGANVEPSFTDVSLNAPLGPLQGPPNLSASPVGSPHLFTLVMTPTPGGPIPSGDPPWPPPYNVANLLVDNEGTTTAKFPSAIPFLSFGAQQNRGNGTRVGRMNAAGSPHKTRWDSTIKMTGGSGGSVLKGHLVFAIARWGGKNRMVQVFLYHQNIDFSTASEPGDQQHWNWAAKDSFYYPGADVAYVDAEDLPTHCNGIGSVPRITNIGQKYSYSINWENVFRCMSDNHLFDDAMPSTPVDIIGVHWAVELFGNASVWAVVEEAEMY